MSNIHVHAPKGHYIGQVRRYGHRKWETVTGRCQSAESAMAKAALAMKPTDFRARVLMLDHEGWYPPRVVMECKR
jgi:hypothetical protein